MADDWGSTEGGGGKKRNPLLWGCGLGCLGLLLVAGVMTFMGVGWVKDALNPEQSLDRLAATLPVEELPEGWTLVFGNKVPFVGLEVFIMQGPGGEDKGHLLASFFVVSKEEGAQEHWNETAPDQGSDRSIEIQGRVLEGVYDANAGGGASFLLMLSEDGDIPVIMVHIQRQNSSVEITDEELRFFFDSFSIGPEGPGSWIGPDQPDEDTDDH
ncbi:MAG: hypothetical protein CMJ86_04465 [Planctomycetes bacterium]|nr:hypothetical protein [Planctomycetota bacterium]